MQNKVRRKSADVVITSTMNKGKRAALFKFAAELVKTLGWKCIVVGYNGNNRIYFKPEAGGYMLSRSGNATPGSRFNVQVRGDKQLLSLCEAKAGGYTLKYDPAEKLRYIDLLQNEEH